MSQKPQPLSGGTVSAKVGAAPFYRGFLRALRDRQHLSNRALARQMGTPDELLDAREKQLEHFFADSENPRASIAKAIEKALGVECTAEDYGWNPETL